MTTRKKLLIGLVGCFLISLGTIFLYAYKTGKIKPKAETISSCGNNLCEKGEDNSCSDCGFNFFSYDQGNGYFSYPGTSRNDEDLDKMQEAYNGAILGVSGLEAKTQEETEAKKQETLKLLNSYKARNMKVILANFNPSQWENVASWYGAHPAVLGFEIMDEFMPGKSGVPDGVDGGISFLQDAQTKIRKYSNKPIFIDIIPVEITYSYNPAYFADRYPYLKNENITKYIDSGYIDGVLFSPSWDDQKYGKMIWNPGSSLVCEDNPNAKNFRQKLEDIKNLWGNKIILSYRSARYSFNTDPSSGQVVDTFKVPMSCWTNDEYLEEIKNQVLAAKELGFVVANSYTWRHSKDFQYLSIVYKDATSAEFSLYNNQDIPTDGVDTKKLYSVEIINVNDPTNHISADIKFGPVDPNNPKTSKIIGILHGLTAEGNNLTIKIKKTIIDGSIVEVDGSNSSWKYTATSDKPQQLKVNLLRQDGSPDFLYDPKTLDWVKVSDNPVKYEGRENILFAKLKEIKQLFDSQKTYRISLNASSSTIPADGKTTSQITAAVTNLANSQPAPNGTEVKFETNKGELGTANVPTQSGQAKTTIKSNEEGPATIKATVGNGNNISIAIVNINFQSQSQSQSQGGGGNAGGNNQFGWPAGAAGAGTGGLYSRVLAATGSNLGLILIIAGLFAIGYIAYYLKIKRKIAKKQSRTR